MKVNHQKTIFICQLSGHCLKVIKSPKGKNFSKVFTAESRDIPVGADDAAVASQIIDLFKKLGYKNDPLIISLPHNYATCRYLRIPAESDEEIEGILSLQLSKYLPCPASDLVTGYQIIATDKEGYSDLNVIIVPKDAIERTMKIFHELNSLPTIVLSSYGLAGLFSFLRPQEALPVMLADIDTEHVELAITENKKVIFSRSFRLSKGQDDWEKIFIEQVNKTQSAYVRETQRGPVSKIVILGSERVAGEFVQALQKDQALPVENISYAEKLALPREAVTAILNTSASFASLIGLAIEEQGQTLHLLPQALKDKHKETFQARSLLRFVALFSGIVLTLSLATAKNLDNKAMYLSRLNQELEKLGKEAQPLEDIQDRLQVIKNQSLKRASALDILVELYKITPEDIGLVNVIYEDGGSLALRGQTPKLNSVFTFVEHLESSKVFKGFSVKVKYATQGKTGAGETVDFEIACVRNKP
jgi:Tfp pilus assembly protein PilN